MKGSFYFLDMRRLTTEEFIIKANLIHNNKYDYSKVNYINNLTKVEIICKTHGSFWQSPCNHLKGQGCIQCSILNSNRTPANNLKDFIFKANLIHNTIYNYSKVNYVNSTTRVSIICELHGIFEQTPYDHLQGHGCPICSNNKKLTSEEFISKAQQIHKGLYDYSLVHYTNTSTKVEIICKQHGIFEQTPNKHLSGQGCPLCGGSKRLTTEQFILKAQRVHKELYDYSLVHYVNSKTPIEIICKTHGIFKQKPNKHLSGHGCPKCSSSRGECEIENWLIEHNVAYETQKKFQTLGLLSYDFYVPSYNLLIEYNGIQHYKFSNFFHKDLHDFHFQKHRDWLKRNFANKQGISLLVIPYWESIERILNEEINN